MLLFRSIPCSSCKHAVRPIRRMHCHALSTSGARFVRKHILRLAPYKPIVPFEILSGIIACLRPEVVDIDLFQLISCNLFHRGARDCTRGHRQTRRERESVWPTARFFFSHSIFATSPHHTLTEVEMAMSNLRFPHVYPDPESRTLRRALVETLSSYERYSQYAAPKVHYSPNLTQAADCTKPVENILVGCGADEVIPVYEHLQCHLSFHIFC